MQDFFLLNLQHHTSPLLDFPIHHSPTNIESARCDVKVIKEGPSSEEGAYVWSLKKSYGNLHSFQKNVNSQLVVLHFLQKGKGVELFWPRCMPMWRPMGVPVMTFAMKFGSYPCFFSKRFSAPQNLWSLTESNSFFWGLTEHGQK